MSLRGERGRAREDDQRGRSAMGCVTQQGGDLGCPWKCTDLGLMGSCIGQSLYQVAVAQAVACLHPYVQLDRTCVNSELLTDWIWGRF